MDQLLDMLETGAPSPISALESHLAPPDIARYAFLREEHDPQAAREELAEAVSLLVERPALEAALAAATARFASDPEGAFAEQQRLLKRKLDFEARLGHMASERAARAARNDSSAPSAHDPADRQEVD